MEADALEAILIQRGKDSFAVGRKVGGSWAVICNSKADELQMLV
jgi:hypothetical protein